MQVQGVVCLHADGSALQEGRLAEAGVRGTVRNGALWRWGVGKTQAFVRKVSYPPPGKDVKGPTSHQTSQGWGGGWAHLRPGPLSTPSLFH